MSHWQGSVPVSAEHLVSSDLKMHGIIYVVSKVKCKLLYSIFSNKS